MTCEAEVVYLVEEHPGGAGPMTYWLEAFRQREEARAEVTAEATRRGTGPLTWRQQGSSLAARPRPGITAPTYLILAVPVR